MLTTQQLIAENQSRWEKCEITPSRLAAVNAVAKRLTEESAKRQYTAIQQATGVPWWVIAVIHEREASQNFMCSLAQGDPWNEISKHVPKGRGPFKSFLDAAVDALKNCAPYAAKWTDWTAGGLLTLLERYNGLGYEEYHAEASPYNWGATNQEQPGKYVSDGEYSPTVWDTQIGCSAMLKAMMQLDKTISIPPVVEQNSVVQSIENFIKKEI